jgi:hypothetical protein
VGEVRRRVVWRFPSHTPPCPAAHASARPLSLLQLFPDIVAVFGTEVKAKPKPGEPGAEGEPVKKKIEVITFIDSTKVWAGMGGGGGQARRFACPRPAVASCLCLTKFATLLLSRLRVAVCAPHAPVSALATRTRNRPVRA